MAWEMRHGKLVYVRKVREGARVRSIYFGSGERAEEAAREDEEHRYTRRSRRTPGVRPPAAGPKHADEPEASAPPPAVAAPAAHACPCPAPHASAFCTPDRQAYADDFFNRDDTGARLGSAWVASSADGSADELIALQLVRGEKYETRLARVLRRGAERLEELTREPSAQNVALAEADVAPAVSNVALAENSAKGAKSDDVTPDSEPRRVYRTVGRKPPRRYRTVK